MKKGRRVLPCRLQLCNSNNRAAELFLSVSAVRTVDAVDSPPGNLSVRQPRRLESTDRRRAMPTFP